jgi:hypothetical protein
VTDRLLARRLTSLLAVLALIGTPAFVLRVFCVGKSCQQSDAATTSVPFCPLPADVRAAVAAGFRAGRSPDVMAATASPVGNPLYSATWPLPLAPWPSSDTADMRVPIAFIGPQVTRRTLPAGMGLDQIAPTLAETLHFERPHPEVRAGTAVPLGLGGIPAREIPPLVVEIAWVGEGAGDLGDAWPRRTAALIHASGAGTMRGSTGSLPLDPAAILTTIGTGGLPSQHGITGSLIRGDHGVAVPWVGDAPDSVISTLADDLRHFDGARSRAGIVEARSTDRGLVGNGWYLGASEGDVVPGGENPVTGVTRLLRRGYGASDGAPDVLGIVLSGTLGSDSAIDRRTAAIVRLVRDRVPGALFVVAGTGDALSATPAASGWEIAQHVDTSIGRVVVSASVAGGLFLDDRALDTADLTSDAVVQAMQTLETRRGTPQFAQVYPSFAVSFARYC